MSHPYDPTLKALVETVPEDWLALIGAPPAPVEVLDADVATVSGAADKVLRVRSEPEWLLHLEFHTGHDGAQLPALLYVRNALFHHRHALPVRSVVIVLRREADSPRLNERYEQRLPQRPGPYLVFEYEVCRVWLLDPEMLLAGGPGTLPLAPISNVTDEQVPGIIHRMEQRLEMPDIRPSDVASVWDTTCILLGLRFSAEVAHHLIQGVRSMKESTTYQAILEEGRLLEVREYVIDLGTEKFGPPDAATIAALEAITDLARLRELRGRVLSATDWQDLLGAPAAPPRRRGRRR